MVRPEVKLNRKGGHVHVHLGLGSREKCNSSGAAWVLPGGWYGRPRESLCRQKAPQHTFLLSHDKSHLHRPKVRASLAGGCSGGNLPRLHLKSRRKV